MNRVLRFIQTGFSTWASAACGNYHYGSDEIRAMEKEIFSRDYSLRGDRASMAKDRDNVRKDMKKAFQQVKPELWPLSNAEQIQRHQDMTKKMNLVSENDRRFFKISALSVICAFLIMVLGMLLSAYLIYKDKDIIGTIFAGATILTVAGMFLSNARKGGYGGKSDTEPT
jgi:hypothetical protein